MFGKVKRMLMVGFQYLLVKFFKMSYNQFLIDRTFLNIIENHNENVSGPVIFIPTHRSYLDFLVISYVLLFFKKQAPFIAAADDMAGILGVSYLFKNSGAFFIKRSGLRFPKIYRTYLAEYIDYILQSGKNIEFFIEGTRSRTAKVLPPKFGVLKYIYESFLNKSIKNAVLLPLTINYENVIEIDQLINEWFGRSKKKESLTQLIKAMGILRNNYGDIFVKIGQPIYLSTFTEKNQGENFDILLEKLADEVSSQLEENTLIMNTTLISIIFLLNKNDLIFSKFFKQMDMLVEIIKTLGGKINKNYDNELILKSCQYFSFLEVDLVQKMIVFKSKINTFSTFKLLYYKNFSFYLFVKDAIIVSVLKGLSSKNGISIIDLERHYEVYSDLFREETFKIKFIETKMIEYISHNNLGIYQIDKIGEEVFVLLKGQIESKR